MEISYVNQKGSGASSLAVKFWVIWGENPGIKNWILGSFFT